MKKTICLFFAIASVVLGCIGFFVLPENVAVQFTFTGDHVNRMPKIVAILVPMFISIVGVYFHTKGNDESSKTKGLILSIVGVVVIIATMIVNLVIL